MAKVLRSDPIERLRERLRVLYHEKGLQTEAEVAATREARSRLFDAELARIEAPRLYRYCLSLAKAAVSRAEEEIGRHVGENEAASIAAWALRKRLERDGVIVSIWGAWLGSVEGGALQVLGYPNCHEEVLGAIERSRARRAFPEVRIEFVEIAGETL